MSRIGVAAALAFAAIVAACGSDPEVEPEAPPEDPFSAGDTTVFVTNRDAFAQPVANLVGDRRDDFFTGNAIFNRGWVTAPASVSDFDGLGPLFNAGSCSGCHFKDGRGSPPEKDDEPFLSMLLRLSVPGTTEVGAPLPEPTYGDQLQNDAIRGIAAEGVPRVRYAEQPGTYADGTPYALRVPTYVVEQPGYGPLAAGTMVSPRAAPVLAGLGLLEVIPEASILANADPDDRDRDGISGRANRVWDESLKAVVLGRFGWKANQPSLLQQNAAAFVGDMGITSSLFSAETCTGAQEECRLAPRGNDPQLRDDLGAQVLFYSRTLGIPARRGVTEPKVRQGRKTFDRLGCGSCHTPTFETGDSPEFPELAHKIVHPFSDLLLHDMGPELADGRPDFDASGSEWRTPPLWGIGLVKTVNRHTYFLHDGRARGFAEAVLWHGGEAAKARDAFKALAAADREALVSFLESL